MNEDRTLPEQALSGTSATEVLAVAGTPWGDIDHSLGCFGEYSSWCDFASASTSASIAWKTTIS